MRKILRKKAESRVVSSIQPCGLCLGLPDETNVCDGCLIGLGQLGDHEEEAVELLGGFLQLDIFLAAFELAPGQLVQGASLWVFRIEAVLIYAIDGVLCPSGVGLHHRQYRKVRGVSKVTRTPVSSSSVDQVVAVLPSISAA